MSSTILYKFRSGTTFEALSLPGSNARLIDIKKAIVTAKRLDQGSMDFDLSVKDATTGIEYMDDTNVLPRGTRIVVQRLPSARGQGILAKIARSQFGDRAEVGNVSGTNGPNADFYTIDSRDRDEDEEFVSTFVVPPPPPPPPPSTDDSELAALRAATDTNNMSGGMGRGAGGTMLRGGPISSGGGFRPNQPAGLGPPPSRGLDSFLHSKPNNRPDADPEIREQEHQPQKKRATGIPRTFLSLSAPQGTEGADGSGLIIQPNTFVFDELINRGGGQSENATGSKRDLDYALKLTATTIPEYLQCAVCHNVVRDAMMLPWDPEGRTTCEQCIRTALTENGFRCPLTQQEGVSPDDLLPNHALRKAAVQFVSDVMEKMKGIVQDAEHEEDINEENEKQIFLEGDLNDKGVVLTRRGAAAEKRKQDNDDFAGGDDDFGGDVFAVEAEKPADDVVDTPMIAETDATEANAMKEINEENQAPSDHVPEQSTVETKPEEMDVDADVSAQAQDSEKVDHAVPSSNVPVNDMSNRRVANRRRGPPVGYTMGPAIAAVQHSPDSDIDRGPSFERGSYHGRRGGGRTPYSGGRGFRGRYDPHATGSQNNVRDDYSRSDDNAGEETRVAKRHRSQSESGNDDISTNDEQYRPQESGDDGESGGRVMIPRGDFRSRGRGGRWSGRGNRGVGFENRAGRWGDNAEGGNDDVSLNEGGENQQDNWSNSDTQRGRGEFRSHGRGGRWVERGGRDNGFNRGGFRGGFRGGREEFRSGGYRGGDYEGFRGGRGGYRGRGRGRY